jgi:AraC family transcriptional regulator
VEPGHLFLTPGGGDAYEMRYVSKSDDLIQNVQLHLDAQFLAKIGQETADLDPLQIELLERSAVRDPVIEQICLMLKRELEQGGLGSQLYAESTAQLLAVHLLRDYCMFEHHVQEYSGGLPKNRLHRVIRGEQTTVKSHPMRSQYPPSTVRSASSKSPLAIVPANWFSRG